MTLLAVMLTGCASSSWQTKLQNQIPVLGHRNWIVIADSAYPMQSNPGIETIYTDKGQVEVLEHVLQELENASHVRPVVMVDRELEFVSETDAPGVNQYRTRLKKLLEDKHVKTMPHEAIIRQLDEGAELFNILLLKTDMTIPYTSVFLELDGLSSFWNAVRAHPDVNVSAARVAIVIERAEINIEYPFDCCDDIQA